MIEAIFVTDLHGRREQYLKLFQHIKDNPPEIVFMGGDLLPPFVPTKDFINDFLKIQFLSLKETLGERYPFVVLIMGNDDPRYYESTLIAGGSGGLWTYLNERRLVWNGYILYGYNFVPPTPFMLKDWERYDVSRYVDPGCVSPEEGRRSFPATEHEMKWSTIKDDLEKLAAEDSLQKAIFLFHSPPYETALDEGDLKGQMIDHVPLDEHLGSIAIKRFIEERQPLLSLHGHIHESTAITGQWIETIERTVCINGAGEGGMLPIIRIDLENPSGAERFEI